MTKPTGPGFRRRTYLLKFGPDSGFDGLEVRMRGMSVDTLARLAQLADLKGRADGEFEAADLGRLEPMWEAVAGALIEWNVLDDDGAPVPVTLDAVRSEDLSMLFAIVDAWQTQVAGVSGPLGRRSPGGGPSAAPPIPMEALPESQAS